MTTYLYLDAFQTIILFFLFLSMLIKSILNLKKIKPFKLLPILPFAGTIQLLFSSFGIAIYNKEVYRQIYEIITSSYLIIELLVLSSFYYNEFNLSPTYKRITISIMTLLILFTSIYFALSGMGINENPYFLILCSIFFFILSMVLYIKMIYDDTIKNLFEHPEFYLNSAIFTLYSCTLPINIFNAIIQREIRLFFIVYSTINSLSYIFFYILTIKFIECKINTR